MLMNLASDLERRGDETPDRLALAIEDGRTWTFGQLEGLAAGYAQSLSEAGLAPGDRLALYLDNGPDLAILLFAAWKVGAIPITISRLYGSEELTHSLADTQPKLLVAEPNAETVLGSLAQPPPIVIVGETLRAKIGAQVRAPQPQPGAEAVILFTGGTTGAPKAVRVTHEGVLVALRRLAAASKGGRPGPYPLAAPEVSPNLVALPLFHGGGQHTLLFAFHVGRPAVLMTRFRVDTCTRLVEQWKIDNLFLVPTMLHDLCAGARPDQLATVRSVLVAGQELSAELRRRFEEKFQIPILLNYGSTEVGHVAGWTMRDVQAGLWRPGAAGRLYPDVEVEIRSDDGTPLAPGQIGEITVKTNMTRGYAGDDSASLVRDGWVATGDVGYLDPTRVLYLSGRKRELIKTGGFQVWPAEIEEVLRRHPDVDEVVVVGIADERLGEVPCAVVVPRDLSQTGPALELALIDYSRANLAHYKGVRKVLFVPDLPRSEAGKIQRGEVAAIAREQSVASKDSLK